MMFCCWGGRFMGCFCVVGLGFWKVVKNVVCGGLLLVVYEL